ncbi:hypothetical protein ALC57_02259 [Trachymyrmex cornetzi]|uniref:Uncharacterized protein n=1 Tax=Trachymyrmex cornetzi TaxID=471704 RepID=A0A195EK07_9HYME|nr:hypothetical protein ALC57_02259 [Trachymyrmex cornetzi]
MLANFFFCGGFCASGISNDRYFCCIDSSQLEHIAVYPSQCTLSAYFVTCVKSAANQGNKALVVMLMQRTDYRIPCRSPRKIRYQENLNQLRCPCTGSMANR